VIGELLDTEAGDRRIIRVEVGGHALVVDGDSAGHLDPHPGEVAARGRDGEDVRSRCALVAIATVRRPHEPDDVETPKRSGDHSLERRLVDAVERQKGDDVAGEDHVAMRAGEDDPGPPPVALPRKGGIERLFSLR
jgi:hypothetical protein